MLLVHPQVHNDERGFFMESWERRKFAAGGIDVTFVQDNHSRSIQHALRGLHYQTQLPQGKLVRVTSGEVFDVAVDLRSSSATFGQWVGQRLSDQNKRMIWVPPGFAHGFLVLSTAAEVQYKCSEYYAPQFERTIRWDDSQLNIDWPLPQGVAPVVSRKDNDGVSFCDAELYP